MKTKLLKKVRKRFTILYVTRLDNPSHYLYEYRGYLPFYILRDEENEYRQWFDPTYDGAHKKLVLWMKKEYPHHLSYKRELVTIEKVWYNGK
jgi:hypothetical protein